MARNSSRLNSGLRLARTVPGVLQLGEPRAEEGDGEKRWILPLTIQRENSCEFIPAISEWEVAVDQGYPLGDIDIHPAPSGGLTVTFPHQELNRSLDSRRAGWRPGKVCLADSFSGLNRRVSSGDLIEDPDCRLAWHVERLVHWLDWVEEWLNEGTGDEPFELPDYRSLIHPAPHLIIHDESDQTLHHWLDARVGEWGLVVWESLPSIPGSRVATAFEDWSSGQIRTGPMFDSVRHSSSNVEERLVGYWWLWPDVAICRPWHVPITWGELRSAGKAMGIKVDSVLRAMTKHLRGRPPEILLIGYPIPRMWFGDPTEIHWQAIQLPGFAPAGVHTPNGFRRNERGDWFRDRTGLLGDRNGIVYQRTENWHPDRLQARGRLGDKLREGRVAIVGCGALGSAVAEILVRGGVHDVLLIDSEILEAGNLVRHSLTTADLGHPKAAALERRLKAINPFARVEFAKTEQLPVPLSPLNARSQLESRDFVFDCTGSDHAYLAIQEGWEPTRHRLFVCGSIGYGGERVFLLLAPGDVGPTTDLLERLRAQVESRRATVGDHDPLLEGPGCWSPLFPCGFADVLIAAAMIVKAADRFLSGDGGEPQVRVFERDDETGTFKEFAHG